MNLQHLSFHHSFFTKNLAVLPGLITILVSLAVLYFEIFARTVCTCHSKSKQNSTYSTSLSASIHHQPFCSNLHVQKSLADPFWYLFPCFFPPCSWILEVCRSENASSRSFSSSTSRSNLPLLYHFVLHLQFRFRLG